MSHPLLKNVKNKVIKTINIFPSDVLLCLNFCYHLGSHEASSEVVEQFGFHLEYVQKRKTKAAKR